MQERQQTTTSNAYYDLVSVLYHALQSAQTSATYIQDAEQAGQQQVAMFFRELQQEANRQAEQAKNLLNKLENWDTERGQAGSAMLGTEHML